MSSSWYISFCLMLFGQVAIAEEGTFILMRNSLLDSSMRIHIASFDTDEGSDYNSENCWLAADLFQNQPGVLTRFWCEASEGKE